jgi:hypothetical protein
MPHPKFLDKDTFTSSTRNLDTAFEWVCMKMVWPEDGPAHSVAMVEDELRGLEAEFAEGVFIRRPALFARKIAIRHLYRSSIPTFP